MPRHLLVFRVLVNVALRISRNSVRGMFSSGILLQDTISLQWRGEQKQTAGIGRRISRFSIFSQAPSFVRWRLFR